MMVDDEAFRRESQPLKPECWVGAEIRPARVTFVDRALRFDMDDITVPRVPIDLLRLIEGVHP